MDKKKAEETLVLFNRQVSKLETSKFFIRYKQDVPNVVAKFEKLHSINQKEDGSFEFVGQINSWLEEFDQEEIDAFVLTYRMFIQNNDRISIAQLATVYRSEWMPVEAKRGFDDARDQANSFLDETGTTFMVEERNFSTRELMETVIYGGLAHLNHEKQLLFDALSESPISGFLMAEFIAALRNMMTYLLYFRSLNEAVLINCLEHAATFQHKKQ